MSIAFQASLFDDLQAEPAIGALGREVERLDLGQGAWLDIRPGWVTDSDALFERLVEDVEWTADTRLMHGRVVEVPRLLSWFGPRAALPAPVLVEARDALNDHYGRPPGQVLETAGLCFYRTGDDSVAWHGDLVVMGGSAQRTHEHAILKTAKAVGPRISIQFRPVWPV
jgi:alkylated DNA repair dioxygenase AlkB